MKAIIFTLAFVMPALLLPAAERDRAGLADEFLSLQEAHGAGRANQQWPKVRPDIVKYVAEIYNEDELRGIIAFYKTPAGEALLTKDSKIQQRTTVEYVKLVQEVYSQRAAQARATEEALTIKERKPGSASTPSSPPAMKAAPPQNSLELAKMLLEELRLLDAATDQWAIEKNKRDGEIPMPKDVLVYMKPGTRLRTSLESGRCVDALGNPLKLPPVGTPPAVSRRSVDQLSTVVPRDFWKPFTIE